MEEPAWNEQEDQIWEINYYTQILMDVKWGSESTEGETNFVPTLLLNGGWLQKKSYPGWNGENFFDLWFFLNEQAGKKKNQGQTVSGLIA